MNPDSAVSKVYTEFAELLAGVEDPLIAERAADLRDVRDRLLRILSGQETSKLSSFSEDVILVAHDLLPSDTATMDRKHIKGILDGGWRREFTFRNPGKKLLEFLQFWEFRMLRKKFLQILCLPWMV